MKRERERERGSRTLRKRRAVRESNVRIRFSREYPRKRRMENDETHQRRTAGHIAQHLEIQFPARRPMNEKCETRVALRCGSTTVRASLVDFLKGPIGYLHDRSGPEGATKTSFVSPRFDSYFAKIANRAAKRRKREREGGETILLHSWCSSLDRSFRDRE